MLAIKYDLGPQKISSFWSSVGFKISTVTRFFRPSFFLPAGKYVGIKFPIYKVWWLKSGLTNQANVHTHKNCLKHSTAEFQSVQQLWLQLDIFSEQKIKLN